VVSVVPPDEACRFLVDLANLRGGPDNITVITVRVGKAGTDPAVSTRLPPRPRKPLLERVPWPYFALAGGSLLAGLAIALKVGLAAVDALAVMLFLLAVIPIVAGIVGLVIQQRRQQAMPPEESYQARVHQQKSCIIDRALVEQLSRAVQTLKQRADEKQWDPDLPAYEEHHGRAQQHLKDNDLPGALREFCRAMRPLNEALHRHRNKEEVFQPVWDRAKE
jgi:protein phosphatase